MKKQNFKPFIHGVVYSTISFVKFFFMFFLFMIFSDVSTPYPEGADILGFVAVYLSLVLVGMVTYSLIINKLLPWARGVNDGIDDIYNELEMNLEKVENELDKKLKEQEYDNK